MDLRIQTSLLVCDKSLVTFLAKPTTCWSLKPVVLEGSSVFIKDVFPHSVVTML